MTRRSKLELPKFSLADFLQSAVDERGEVELEGTISIDGEHFVISPLNGLPGTLLRLRQADVRLSDAAYLGQPVRMRIKRNAPCVRLAAGVVEDFIGLDSGLYVAVKRAKIQLDATGKGTLNYAGRSVPCLGKQDFPYVKDLTVKGEIDVDKFKQKFSNEFSVWMYWAVLIMGSRGVYIHEGAVEGTSAGCIHLAAPTAKEFYDWIDGPTRIEIAYSW